MRQRVYIEESRGSSASGALDTVAGHVWLREGKETLTNDGSQISRGWGVV